MTCPLYVLFAVLLVDQLDAGMLLPILPALLTDADGESLVIDPADADGLGVFLVAILGAAYAVPAFFAQPVLGQLADRHGRKPLLALSFASSAVAFFLFAWGAAAGSIATLIVARVIDGLAAGNVLVAMAAVGDVAEEADRTRTFGILTATLSLGFVFGPLLGGYLGDPETASWTGPAAAFAIAGALNALALAAFWFGFVETLPAGDRDADAEGVSVWRALGNAREAFADERRRPYYLVQLCYTAGYTFFVTFYAVVLEERLGLDAAASGRFFAAMGVALAAVQFVAVDRAERALGPRLALRLALFAAAGAVTALALAPTLWVAYAALIPFALGGGIVDPMIASLLSRSAPPHRQGRIQGVRGSVDAAAGAVPPFLAAPLASAGSSTWAVAAGAGVIAVGGGLALALLPPADEAGD